jgi:RNA polymerase sigma-70 factor (ECF subfamily)
VAVLISPAFWLGATPAPVLRELKPEAARLAPEEMARVVRTHYARLWRVTRRFGVAEGDVDDALQQVFLVAASKLASDAPENEEAYMCSIAVRVAANVRRKATRSPLVVDDDAVQREAAADGAPDALLERRQLRALLDDALLQLDLELREVFVLCDLEEMPMRAVADVLGIPAGTVASRLRRAREAFNRAAARLAKEGA